MLWAAFLAPKGQEGLLQLFTLLPWAEPMGWVGQLTHSTKGSHTDGLFTLLPWALAQGLSGKTCLPREQRYLHTRVTPLFTASPEQRRSLNLSQVRQI